MDIPFDIPCSFLGSHRHSVAWQAAQASVPHLRERGPAEATGAHSSAVQLEHYQSLIQGLSDLGEGVMLGEGGRILYTNEAMCELSGYTMNELLALPSVAVLAAPTHYAASSERLRRLTNGEQIGRFEGALRRKNGEIVPLEIATKISQHKGTVQFISVMHDISKRKQAEQRFQALTDELEQRVAERTADLAAANGVFVALLNAMPDLMFRLKRDGIFLDVYASDRDDLYLPPEELLGCSMHNVLPPTLAGPLQSLIERSLAHDTTELFEYTLDVPRGLREYEARIGVCGDDQVLVLVRDITERKRTERALRTSEARNRAMLAAIPDTIVRLDHDGTILDFKRAPAPSDLPLDLLVIGKPITDALPFDATLLERFSAMQPGDAPISIEYTIPQHFGEYLLAQHRITAAQIAQARATQEAARATGRHIMIGEALVAQDALPHAQMLTLLDEWHRKRSFRDLEISIGATSADSIVMVLRDIAERKRAEAQTRQQIARTTIIADLDRAIGQAGLDEHHILDTFMASLATQLPALCLLSRTSSDEHWLLPAAASHPDAELARAVGELVHDLRWPANAPAIKRLIQGGQPPTHIAKTGAWHYLPLDNPRFRSYLGSHELSHMLAVPLRSGAATIGLLTLCYTGGDQRALAGDQEFIHELVNRAALALENARLYRAAQQEIAERNQAEQALKLSSLQTETLNKVLHRSRDLLRTLLDALQDGLLLLDAQGRVLAINNAFASLLENHTSDLVGLHWGEFSEATTFLPFSWQDAQAALQGSQSRHRRERYTLPNGTVRVLDSTLFPIVTSEQTVEQMIVRVVDVSERLQIETQMLEQERFAASGRLAATVAHEVNSPLQAVESCLHMAERATEQRRAQYLQIAREEVIRVGQILRQLLDVFQPSRATPAPIDLNALIERVLLLTGSTMARQDIVVDFAPMPTLPTVWGYSDEITQVLLNLVMNATYAMPHGGQLYVLTKRRAVPAPGEVIVEVSDTGIGMEKNVEARIFEPFFSTKSEGTGLGLAISQKIVHGHKGTISVRSVPNAGTTFTIRLPVGDDLSSSRTS